MQDGDMQDGDVPGPDLDEAAASDETVADPAPFEPTGHQDVDRALAALDGLEQREVHEHVGAFEEAHGALRRALDRPTDGSGASGAEPG